MHSIFNNTTKPHNFFDKRNNYFLLKNIANKTEPVYVFSIDTATKIATIVEGEVVIDLYETRHGNWFCLMYNDNSFGFGHSYWRRLLTIEVRDMLQRHNYKPSQIEMMLGDNEI